MVELACNKGKSTVAMAFACVGTRKHIYSIDTYEGNEGQMGKEKGCVSRRESFGRRT